MELARDPTGNKSRLAALHKINNQVLAYERLRRLNGSAPEFMTSTDVFLESVKEITSPFSKHALRCYHTDVTPIVSTEASVEIAYMEGHALPESKWVGAQISLLEQDTDILGDEYHFSIDVVFKTKSVAIGSGFRIHNRDIAWINSSKPALCFHRIKIPLKHPIKDELDNDLGIKNVIFTFHTAEIRNRFHDHIADWVGKPRLAPTPESVLGPRPEPESAVDASVPPNGKRPRTLEPEPEPEPAPAPAPAPEPEPEPEPETYSHSLDALIEVVEEDLNIETEIKERVHVLTEEWATQKLTRDEWCEKMIALLTKERMLDIMKLVNAKLEASTVSEVDATSRVLVDYPLKKHTVAFFASNWNAIQGTDPHDYDHVENPFIKYPDPAADESHDFFKIEQADAETIYKQTRLLRAASIKPDDGWYEESGEIHQLCAILMKIACLNMRGHLRHCMESGLGKLIKGLSREARDNNVLNLPEPWKTRIVQISNAIIYEWKGMTAAARKVALVAPAVVVRA